MNLARRLALVMASAAALGAVYVVARSTDPCHAQGASYGRTAFFVTDPACRMSVHMAGRLFIFPTILVTSAGEWRPHVGAYDGPVAFSISGRDFSTGAGQANPREGNKPINVFVYTIPKSSDRSLPEAVVRDGKHRASDLRAAATFPVKPDPRFDRFGLIALRADSAGELFVGRSRDGRAVLFDCSPDDPAMVPMCRRRYHRHGLSVHYDFAKKYLADWQFFDQGVTTLLDQHRTRQQ